MFEAETGVAVAAACTLGTLMLPTVTHRASTHIVQQYATQMVRMQTVSCDYQSLQSRSTQIVSMHELCALDPEGHLVIRFSLHGIFVSLFQADFVKCIRRDILMIWGSSITLLFCICGCVQALSVPVQDILSISSQTCTESR